MRRQWIVIVLCGLIVLTAAVFGVVSLRPEGNIAGTLAAEPLRVPSSPLGHTVMVLDAGSRHFVLRQGIQGNRQFFIVTSIDGNETTGDELSVYDKDTFTGASQITAGARVKIKGRSSPGYFLANGHVLGWELGRGTWAVIRSHSPGEPRQRLLNLAEQVVGTGSRPFRAPFSMSYAPQGFVPTHASRNRLDEHGAWVFGLNKGTVREEAPLTVSIQWLRDQAEDARTLSSLGKPDSERSARQLWHIKAGTPGFSVPSGGAQIVLRRDGGCYAHIRIADVDLIPPSEQEKIANGIVLGLCGDDRGWAYPFEKLGWGPAGN